MDNIVLSQEVLNQQVCTECLKYLSVGPVMVSREGEVMCGRCSHDKRSDLKILHHSLYNLVAAKLIFRCFNYYEGCEKLLHFNEAVEHEKNCKNKECCKCPFCDYEGSGCQLVGHFNQTHPEYVVKEDRFKMIVKDTFSRNLIFVTEKNNIFCLIVSIRDTFIEFFSLLISPVRFSPKQYKLNFFKSDTNVEFITSPIQIAHKLGKLSSSTSWEAHIGCNTNSNPIKSFLLDQSNLLKRFPSGWCLCKIELIDESQHDMEKQLLKKDYLEKTKQEIHTKSPIAVVETKVMETKVVDNEGGHIRYDKDELHGMLKNIEVPQNCNQVANSHAESPLTIPGGIVNPPFVKPIGHDYQNSQRKQFECSQCGHVCSSEIELIYHQQIHHILQIPQQSHISPREQFRCCQCEQVFLSQTDLFNHEKTHFMVQTPQQFQISPREQFQCYQNVQLFLPQIDISNHQQTQYIVQVPQQYQNNSKEQLECPECGRVISSRIGLFSHRRTHYKEQTPQNSQKSSKEQFECPECGRVISSQIGLYSHRRTHYKEQTPQRSQRSAPERSQREQFECSECGRVISSRIGLYSHMRTHNR